jgi:hypothetical protein
VSFVSPESAVDEAGLATVAQCISQRLVDPEASKDTSTAPQNMAKQRWRVQPDAPTRPVTVGSVLHSRSKHLVLCVCCGLGCGRSDTVYAASQ